MEEAKAMMQSSLENCGNKSQSQPVEKEKAVVALFWRTSVRNTTNNTPTMDAGTVHHTDAHA